MKEKTPTKGRRQTTHSEERKGETMRNRKGERRNSHKKKQRETQERKMKNNKKGREEGATTWTTWRSLLLRY